MLNYKEVKRLREAKGWTVAEAAATAGLSSRAHWHDIERGERINLTLEVLDRIAKALGVSAKELLK